MKTRYALNFSVVAAALIAASTQAAATKYTINTVERLQEVINKAVAGDQIVLESGSYDLSKLSGGKLSITRSGKINSPITLQGPASAVLKSKKYALHLEDASYWKLTGFTINGARKGIVLDGASHVLLENLTVKNVAEEGIHFRTSSHDNVLIGSTIVDTGKSKPKYGEGVYVGSAESNWSDIMGSSKKADKVKNTCIAKNFIGPGVTAEAIDIKEGSSFTYVLGNTIDLTGIAGENFADSALDMKGEYIFVYDNTILNSKAQFLPKLKKVPDAFQSHQIDNPAKAPSGTNIWVMGNRANLKSAVAPKNYTAGMVYRSDGKGSNHYCGSDEVASGDVGSNLSNNTCSGTSPKVPETCPAVLGQ